MKRILLITGGTLLALVMLLAVTTSMAMAAGGTFGGGDGSPGNPYQIQDQADLQAMQNGLAAHYILANDITCAAQFTPVGDFDTSSPDDHPFTGSLNGSGYVIYNLYVNYPLYPGAGLFGYISSAVVENVALQNVNITGFEYVGGLVGWNQGGSIINCYVTGRVHGFGSIGGLVGLNSGPISNSYSAGNIHGFNDSIGGIAGHNTSSINNSYATGGVTGDWNVGGLVGSSVGSISNSYSSGGVYGVTNVGGLVGDNTGPITNSFTTGGVWETTNVGGLAGGSSTAPVNCYWFGNGPNNGYGTKETDHHALFFVSHSVYDQSGANPWDFVNTWGMADGSSYPYMGNPGMAAPVFEIWTIVFVSIGLIGIVGFIWYRRRKVSMVAA